MDALENKESVFQTGNEPRLERPVATILVTTLAELTRIIFSATITQIIIRNKIIPTLWKVNITYYNYYSRWMTETAWGAIWFYVIEGLVPVPTLLLHPNIHFKTLTSLKNFERLILKICTEIFSGSSQLSSLSYCRPCVTVIILCFLWRRNLRMLKMPTELIVLFLVPIWKVTAGTSLLHCPCYAGVFRNWLLEQYAVYNRDEKEKLK